MFLRVIQGQPNYRTLWIGTIRIFHLQNNIKSSFSKDLPLSYLLFRLSL